MTGQAAASWFVPGGSARFTSKTLGRTHYVLSRREQFTQARPPCFSLGGAIIGFQTQRIGPRDLVKERTL